MAFLDKNRFLDNDDVFSREEVLSFFKENFIKLEREKKFKTDKVLVFMLGNSL